MATVRIKGGLPIAKIAKSGEIAVQLEPIADQVLAVVLQDPNEEFTKTVRKRLFRTSGRLGRMSWQVGAAPQIGLRVEAKRGVFARAIALIGGK